MDIENGQEIGRVRELVIHPQKRDLLALLVEDEQWWKEAKAISFPLIYGMGEYAVTVQNRQCVAALSELPEIQKTLAMSVHPIGSNVITRSGQLLGQVEEFYLDPKSGKVQAYQLKLKDGETEKETYVLPSVHVLTLGKNIVVVTDDAREHLVSSEEEVQQVAQAKVEPELPPEMLEEKPSQLVEEALEKQLPEPKLEKSQQAEAATAEQKEQAVEMPTQPVTEKPREKEQAPQEVAAAEASPVKASSAPAKPQQQARVEQKASSFASQFIERVKRSLLGKTVKRNVLMPDGSLLVKEGDIITQEVLEKAATDRKLLTQLNFAVK